MNILKKLFDSRKFVAALVTTVTAVLIEFGVPEIEIEEIVAILSPMLVYIGAQGFADRGGDA